MGEKKITVGKVMSNPFILLFDILAVFVSWYFNHSIWWAILHYIIGVPYLIYSAIIGRFANGGFMEIMHHYF